MCSYFSISHFFSPPSSSHPILKPLLAKYAFIPLIVAAVRFQLLAIASHSHPMISPLGHLVEFKEDFVTIRHHVNVRTQESLFRFLYVDSVLQRAKVLFNFRGILTRAETPVFVLCK
jgi:hypothetical protein